LCVSIETVSPFLGINIQLPSWITSFFSNPIDKLENEICSYIVQHPDRAITVINKIKVALQNNNQTNQTFVLTINYLNSPDNQEELTNSTSTCLTFFNGLQNATITDLNNNNINLANSQQTALKKWNDLLNDLKNSLN
jgi:hypothetical protein